jgi:LPS-assembly protein
MRRGTMSFLSPRTSRLLQRTRWFVLLLDLCLVASGALAQDKPANRIPLRVSVGGDWAELNAKEQRAEGHVFYADGNVDIFFQGMHLFADHVEYNETTYEALARGNVQFDYRNQHLSATEAHFNFKTGHGTFQHVRGAVRIERVPNPDVLITPNPVSFEADEVERVNESVYRITRTRLTVCDPAHPKWEFYAPSATLTVDKSVALVNANFRFLRIPLVYLPYATAPANQRMRQSGFLLPEVGTSSLKGFVLGDSYYWAPTDWTDLTAGAQYLSRRGWSQNADFRARPWDDVKFSTTYYGVVDRGLPTGPNGARVPQGGHESNVSLDALLPDGWRAVADLNELTSLTFRLAFADTYNEAVNSEVRNSAFLTNNFHGFSINFALQSYKNFLTVQPETSVVLRSAPEVRFGSVDLAPWRRLPIYFGVDAFADAVHRGDPNIETPSFVTRGEIAPRVTIPLHWGPWLGITPTFTLRTAHYGSSLLAGTMVSDSVQRTTEELDLDIRPPSLERVWERPDSKWKHTIEPEIHYRYVSGVNNFGQFIRFDENETLTDTNEIQYGITQRLYRRSGDGLAEELVTWSLTQKYYFDPTFGGALVPGQRNVFQAFDSLTGFAFGDQLRRFSPVVSDITVTPGGKYDAEFKTDIDPVRGRITAIGTGIKVHPYNQFFVTLAQFNVSSDPVLQTPSNQIRAMVGYGELNRRGWNAAFGLSYDLRQQDLQNQLVQVSYNGSCYGISFEYRRLSLGTVRNENQFRVALTLANVGSFGSVRRQEKIY